MALWKVGTAVNMLVVRSNGTSVIKRKDPGMLASAGGSAVLTKE